MSNVEKGFSRYEMMMKRSADDSFEISEDFLCKGCRYHRPDWDYRFCIFLECPFVKGQQTFWEEVLQGAKQ